MKNSLFARASFYVLCFFFSHVTIAQPVNYYVEAGGQSGFGQHAPYWFYSKQFARYSITPHAAFMAAGVYRKTDTTGFAGYGFGMELLERFDGENTFRFQELWVAGRLSFLTLRAGRFYEHNGNQFDPLSLGGTVWSGNALPIPQVEISTSGYKDLPFTRGYVEFKGQLSHGWFDDERFVDDPLMHHKNLYVKIGGDFPVNVSYGLEHFAMYGGTSPDPDYGKLPDDFDAYKKVFFAENGDSSNVNVNEVINKLGNHLGSKNYGIDVKIAGIKTGFYYQSLFEDNSGKNKFMTPDGLWGIYVDFQKEGLVEAITGEYLNTTYQSGPHHELGVSGGNDNYFNNYIYRSGWTYRGFTMGTPLLTSPVLDDVEKPGIINNRVTAYHIGVKGLVKEVNYTLLLTSSINRGTWSVPFPENLHQFSAWLSLNKNVELFTPLELSLQMGFDVGEMYGNNAGVMVRVRKSGVF